MAVIAQGTNISELEGYDLGGKTLQVYLDHNVTASEAAAMNARLAPYLSAPVAYRGNVVTMKFAERTSEGYSFVWWIIVPLIAAGGFLGWQLVKPGGALENLFKGPMLILAGGAAVALVIWAASKARVTMKA